MRALHLAIAFAFACAPPSRPPTKVALGAEDDEPAPNAPGPTHRGRLLWTLRAESADQLDAQPLAAFVSGGALLWVRPAFVGTPSLVELDEDGEPTWALPLKPSFNPQHFAVGRDGSAAIAGFHRFPDRPGGGRSLVRSSSSGKLLWEKELPPTSSPRSLAVTADGGLVVTGDFTRTVDFGGGPLEGVGPLMSTRPPPLAVSDFVLKLDADGNHVWSKAFAAGLVMVVSAPDGTVLLASAPGEHRDVDYGTGPLRGPAVLARLGADGEALWARQFDFGLDTVLHDPKGALRLLTAAPTTGSIRIGDHEFTGAVLARLDDSGAPLASAELASDPGQVAFDGAGNLFALFDVANADITLAGKPLSKAGGAFRLVKLDPDLALLWQHPVDCAGQAGESASITAAADGRVAVSCVTVSVHGYTPKYAYRLWLFEP